MPGTIAALHLPEKCIIPTSTISHKISEASVKWRTTGKVSMLFWRSEGVASINEIFILNGGMSTRLSFYEV